MLNKWYWSIPISFIISLLIILQPCNLLKGTGQLADVFVNLQNENFVDVREVIPSIQLDIRYYTPYNFVGEPIDGYNAPKCLLTKPAAEALAQVQAALMQTSYVLKVYDCYRPQQATDRFWHWAQDPTDTRMKSVFYPNIEKQDLFRLGYIARQSGHSRGSSIDLTLVSKTSPSQEAYGANQPFIDNSIDMGSAFDLFDPISNTYSDRITQSQLKNRLFLKELMVKYGFKDYALEWWHFTLENEPFSETFFNFPIESEKSTINKGNKTVEKIANKPQHSQSKISPKGWIFKNCSIEF